MSRSKAQVLMDAAIDFAACLEEWGDHPFTPEGKADRRRTRDKLFKAARRYQQGPRNGQGRPKK